MAPKISRSMDDPRIPGAGGGAPIGSMPGKATEMPSGLLKPNGALVPSPGGRTQSQGVGPFGGKPTSN
jgi:hypothetical protein